MRRLGILLVLVLYAALLHIKHWLVDHGLFVEKGMTEQDCEDYKAAEDPQRSKF